jgi:hypothetical protein
MKKTKVMFISLIGVSIMTLGYFFIKKKNIKVLEEESKENESIDNKNIVFSESTIKLGKELRSKINRLRNGKDPIIEEELVNLLARQNTRVRKEVWDWYENQNFSILGDFRGAFERVLSPVWNDRLNRTMMSWKLNGK